MPPDRTSEKLVLLVLFFFGQQAETKELKAAKPARCFIAGLAAFLVSPDVVYSMRTRRYSP
ncbi:MAG: hypothetical protein D3924_08305 [Candidatus Electrothrix sp. AR4]|nr:hypothetical protein [Candidatus Electrothrix sp. AR4]